MIIPSKAHKDIDQMTRTVLIKDKEHMDEIAEKIANREPVKEWAVIYWMAVAIGHLIEWVVTNGKGKRI